MVQGVAEVVPVSSSAQLVLVPWLLGWDPPDDRTGFAAGLHAGSCLGIAAVLRPWSAGPRTLALVAASSVPAAFAGFLAADRVEQRLGRPPQLAALLAGAGVALLAADRSPQTRTQVGPREAGVAALAQVAALVPGVSRSGAVLTALRLLGVERAAAQRFSLLMSLPVAAGAAGLTFAQSRSLPPGWVPGALAAAVAGAVTARLVPPGRSAAVPTTYRLGLAAAVAVRLHRQRRTRDRLPWACPSPTGSWPARSQ